MRLAITCYSIFTFLTFILSSLGLTANAAEPFYERRIVHPPKIDYDHVSDEIVCYRPVRTTSPRYTIQKIGHQVVAHHYGHGGAGWTYGPGSASYMRRQFEASAHTQQVSKDEPITILGAGVIGLMSAYELITHGYTNLTVMAAEFDHLASHNAGGFFSPSVLANTGNMQARINQMGFESYAFYKSIIQGSHPYFSSGAKFLPFYMENRASSRLELYVGHGMRPAKDVIVDFTNGKTRKMVVYDDGIFINTSHMLDQLRGFLEQNGVQFIQRKVRKFSDISSDYIINCTGLGAYELTGDEKLYPVQGHLVTLKDQNPEDLQQMFVIYNENGENDHGQYTQRAFYAAPKIGGDNDGTVGVIGGTFIQDAYPDTPNKDEFDEIIYRARQFYGLR